MFGMGTSELLIILVLVLVLFGGAKIASLGKGLGEGMRNFKEGLRGGDDTTATRTDRQIPGDTNATNDSRRT